MLIKVGQNAHIEKLQKEGLVFSKPITFFRKLEEKQKPGLRKDSREGALNSVRVHNLKVYRQDQIIPFEVNNARLHQFDKGIDNTHIYCLYSVEPKDAIGKPFIDPRILDFGDAALLILDPGTFLNRVQREIGKGHQLDYDFVKYYTEESDYISLDIFHKPQSFNYQKEFRLCLRDFSCDDLEIRIGSIEDISILVKSKDLLSLSLRFE